MSTADTRIVYGFRCVWWDGIEKVGMTPPKPSTIGQSTQMISVPCCPHCGGMLMEMSSPKQWWDGVAKYEADGHPGYLDFIEWLKGKCYPTKDAAKAAYESKPGRRVIL